MAEDDQVVAKQALAQKRNVRDLNTRLEMYVRTMNDIRRQNSQLKKDMATQQVEYTAKITQQRNQLTDTVDRLRADLETISADHKCAVLDLADSNSAKKEYEQRLIAAESRNASLVSETENMNKDICRLKMELDALRQQFASLKYKHESFESERKAAEQRNKETMKQNERLLRDLTKTETERKAEPEANTQVLVDKNEEIERLRKEKAILEDNVATTQMRMRKEFDSKLADFVTKRESQYNLEKDEWMRIFKDEFNRKLACFKEANKDLAEQNTKLSQQIGDLRTRISKLKQQKTELEQTRKSNEEEIERRIDDLDVLRRAKDAEIHDMKTRLDEASDRFKAKEIQFDELASIKLQLDAEIELYRSILNEAEEACGYKSPLDAKYTNTGKRNSRKRRRVSHMTPMGPLTDNTNRKMVVTPGLTRAAKNAEADLVGSFGADLVDEEMKDPESLSVPESESLDSFNTPGDFEGSTLSFSGLDLNRGMIEIQNLGADSVMLSGYTLSNMTGTAQFALPKGMALENKHRLRVYVGGDFAALEGDEEAAKEMVGDYSGAFVFWTKDVWAADEPDCARLYNPQSEEVARIEISPEMVDRESAKKGCSVM